MRSARGDAVTGWCTDRTVLALDGDKWKTRPNDDYERKGGNGFGVNGGGACTP